MSAPTTGHANAEFRINTRVKGPMARHVETVIGPSGLYENQSEYIRDLIRRDMAKTQSLSLENGLFEGYLQMAAGNYRKRPMSEIIERAERELTSENRG